MASELVDASHFIRSQLVADSALVALVADRVHYDFAGPEPVYPLVLILFLGGEDRETLSYGTRAFTRPLWLVEAQTTDGGWTGAQAIDARIDAVLEGRSGTHAGLKVIGVYRERPIRRVEITPSGVRINHLGGEYRQFVY